MFLNKLNNNSELIKFGDLLLQIIKDLTNRIYTAVKDTILYSKKTHITLIFINLLTVAYLASIYDPHFSYDPSNTLNIIKTGYSDISYIIGRENNFIPYYYVLRFISEDLSLNLFGIKIFQYLTWIISIFAFYYLAIEVLSKKNAIFSTLLYTYIPIISLYAFFPRMYAIFVLLVLLYSKFQTGYLKNTKDWKQYIFLIITSILLSMVHPIGLVFYIIIGIYITITSKNLKIWSLNIAPVILGLGIITLQIITRSHVVEAYYTDGLNYINAVQIPYYQIPIRLFFNSARNFTLVFYSIILFLSVSYFSQIPSIIKKGKPAVLLISWIQIVFILFHSVNKHFLTPRHYIYFTPFVLLFIIMSLQDTKTKVIQKYSEVIKIVLFFIFIFMSFKHTNNILASNKINKEYCESIRSIKPGKLITSFATYNPTIYCLGNKTGEFEYYFLDKKGFVDINNMDSIEILYQQASRGGLIGTVSKGYDENIKDISNQEVRQKLNAKKGDLVYIVLFDEDFNKNPSIYMNQIKLLSDFKVKEVIEPYLVVFEAP